MKVLGIDDAAAQQSDFHFISEYPEDPIRIRIEAVPTAPRTETTRANIMNILKCLPLMLMDDRYYAGVNFVQEHWGRPLHNGRLDNKNQIDGSKIVNETKVNDGVATSRKRMPSGQSLAFQHTNASSFFFTVPGTNERLDLRIAFVGYTMSRGAIFSSILQVLFVLGLRDASDSLEATEFATNSLPAWIYVRSIPGSRPLYTFQVLAILEAMARYSVQQNTYQEVLYDFFVEGSLVSLGCITKAINRREWCRGLRGPQGLRIRNGLITPYQ